MNQIQSNRSVEALSLLIEGNRRFMAGLRSVDGTPSPARLRDLAKSGQRPFCLVLSCSDSRVPAEIVFDRGLGDLFLVRVAGNTVGEEMIASLEFAATGFETPLLVVMGHTGCGAIQSAVDAHQKGEDATFASPYLKHLIDHIQPAVEACAHSLEPGPVDSNYLNQVTWANVQNSIEVLLKSSQVLSGLVERGQLLVVGSLFNLDTSQAEFQLTPEMSSQVDQTIRQRLLASMTAQETSSAVPLRRATG